MSMKDFGNVSLLFLYLCFTKVLTLSVDQFVYNNNAGKCCQFGELLSASNNSHECVPDLDPTTALALAATLTKESFGKIPCLDITVTPNNSANKRKVAEIQGSGSNITYIDIPLFPKCCPLNWVYDTLKHQCVNINQTRGIDISALIETTTKNTNKTLALKYGLGECDVVISDHVVSSVVFDDKLGLHVEELTTTIGYGEYCVDNIANKDTYVVRVCHKNFSSICKKKKTDVGKIMCVRKCCKDGFSYRSSPKCTVDFEHGFNLENYTRTFKDSYAVIPGLNCRKYAATKTIDYFLNAAGSVRLTVEDAPSLLMSPFKHNYCFEYAKVNSEERLHLFLCFLKYVGGRNANGQFTT